MGDFREGKGMSTSSTEAIIKNPLGKLWVLAEPSPCNIKQLALLRLRAV